MAGIADGSQDQVHYFEEFTIPGFTIARDHCNKSCRSNLKCFHGRRRGRQNFKENIQQPAAEASMWPFFAADLQAGHNMRSESDVTFSYVHPAPGCGLVLLLHVIRIHVISREKILATQSVKYSDCESVSQIE